MKHAWKSGTLPVFIAAALLSAALLGGCGSSSQETIGPATGNVLSATTPTAGLSACAACHTRVTADWLTSKHANLDPGGNLYSYGVPTVGIVQTGGAACIRCHNPNGDSGNLTFGYTGNNPRPVIGCETCHGPGSLHANAGGAGPIFVLSNTTGTVISGATPTVLSAQFVMCTDCHELLNKTTGGLNSSPTHSTGAPAPTGPQYIITDTHFATPGVFSCIPPTNMGNCNNITGYAMNYGSETVCTDCHNPHKTADINKEWAASLHADKISDHAWAHYNWSCDASACGGPSWNRTSCQRCHTTTGFAAYAVALQSGNITLAEAIRTGSAPPLSPNLNFKPEMLKCNGCHSDNRGTLRNPGKYIATYAIGTAPNASVTFQYPDVGASNVCMTCHTGRNSGKAISQLNTGQTATVDFSNFAYRNVDGHYLTASGTMFKGPAYEYTRRSYTDPGTFRHKNIGTSAEPGTGTMGPCIGCHMDRTGMPGNHLFEPVSASTGTLIVTSTVCFQCHAGSSIDFGAIVEDEKNNYGFALQALQNQLFVSNPSYSFTTTFPYFTNSSWLIFGDTDITGNTGGKNTLGAAFNFSLLYHEPGAFVHNSRYVKRIIYDSIDWLDNGVMDFSVGATLTSACTSTPQPWCAGAKAYLQLINVNAQYTSGERP